MMHRQHMGKFILIFHQPVALTIYYRGYLKVLKIETEDEKIRPLAKMKMFTTVIDESGSSILWW